MFLEELKVGSDWHDLNFTAHIQVDPQSNFNDLILSFAHSTDFNHKTEVEIYNHDLARGDHIGPYAHITIQQHSFGLNSSYIDQNSTVTLRFSGTNHDNAFKLNLDEVTANFKKTVSNYVDIRIETQKEIVEQGRISKDETIKEIRVFIENNFNNLINEIESKSKYLRDKVANITETKNNQKELIKNSSEKISEVNILANNITDEIKQLATTTTVPFEQDLINEIENVNNILENLKENYVNANEKLEKLKKSVESLKEL